MFEVLAQLFVGFLIGWAIIFVIRIINGMQMNQQIISGLHKGQELVDQHIIMMDVTKDKGIYYCWDDKDNSFVCQGKDYKEIVQAFKERFPDRIFFINDRFKKYFPEDFKQSKFAIQTEE